MCSPSHYQQPCFNDLHTSEHHPLTSVLCFPMSSIPKSLSSYTLAGGQLGCPKIVLNHVCIYYVCAHHNP